MSAEPEPDIIRNERGRERRQAEWDARHGVSGRPEESANAPELLPAFVIPDLTGFMSAELSPPRFIVEKLVPRGTVTLLGAHGGSGKSVLALTIAAHVAAELQWAGFDIAGGSAVFVSLEDPAALMLYRLRRIATAYSLPMDRITANFRILDGTEGDGALGKV
jgi:hypothetical protein